MQANSVLLQQPETDVWATPQWLFDALHKELQQMNRIIEEYTTLLEKTARTLGSRK